MDETSPTDELVEVTPPAGWYVTPEEPARQRYWTGYEWTGKARKDMRSAPAFPGVRRVLRSELPRPDVPREVKARRIIVTPALEVPGYQTAEHRREVFGSTVRTRNMFADAFATFRDAAGGEVRGYTKMLDEARDEAVLRLRVAALDAEADAVIALHVAINQVQDASLQVLAYGAAVRLRALGDPHARPAGSEETGPEVA